MKLGLAKKFLKLEKKKREKATNLRFLKVAKTYALFSLYPLKITLV